MPTVSVVIATYNRARMVREAVLAAWAQTRRPDEIVVSDDCSTDDTVATLEALQATVPVLRIVTSAQNSGGVPNWNQVIDAARGDIIAWCSDDDCFEPEHLERSTRFLSEQPGTSLVHAGFSNIQVDDAGVISHSAPTLKSQTHIPIDAANVVDYFSHNFSWPFHPSTFVFTRSLWKRVGQFDPHFALADTEWFLRAAMHHRIVYLPHVGVRNRRHTGPSGNWSNRVGSVVMQRELYDSIASFVMQAREQRPDAYPAIQAQFAEWKRRYFLLLLRIFVSRSRAGSADVARASVEEMARVFPALNRLPTSIVRGTCSVASRALYGVQSLIPGGRRKYEQLGKFTPS